MSYPNEFVAVKSQPVPESTDTDAVQNCEVSQYTQLQTPHHQSVQQEPIDVSQQGGYFHQESEYTDQPALTPYSWAENTSTTQLVSNTPARAQASNNRQIRHRQEGTSLPRYSLQQRIRFWTAVADPIIIASHPRAFILDPRSKITYELSEGALELKGIRGAVYRFRKDPSTNQVLQILIVPPADGTGRFSPEEHIFTIEQPVTCDPSVVTHNFTKRNWRVLLDVQELPESVYWNSRLRRPFDEATRLNNVLVRRYKYELAAFVLENAQVSYRAIL